MNLEKSNKLVVEDQRPYCITAKVEPPHDHSDILIGFALVLFAIFLLTHINFKPKKKGTRHAPLEC